MPTSNVMFKSETIDYIKNKFKDKSISILDVGAGIGTYSDLLKDEYDNMDCCEIYEPYIDKYQLRNKYNNVYVKNIIDFEFEYYDLIIMGDILEHIDKDTAILLLNEIVNKCEELIVCVPYQLPAGPYEGNNHEAHLQDDLNPTIMDERYPMLKGLFVKFDGVGHQCGVYCKGERQK